MTKKVWKKSFLPFYFTYDNVIYIEVSANFLTTVCSTNVLITNY